MEKLHRSCRLKRKKPTSAKPPLRRSRYLEEAYGKPAWVQCTWFDTRSGTAAKLFHKLLVSLSNADLRIRLLNRIDQLMPKTGPRNWCPFAPFLKSGIWAMARRHEVQNLLRRGNIWYWRPRLPVSLSQSDLNGKLSFSLKQSDHHRARFMARRLNSLLAELRMRPGAAMTRKENLKALFQAKIARMNEMMDDLVTAAEATGSQINPGHLQADVITGWAYRLLEKFGTAIDLSFDDQCPGWQYLKQNKVPDDFLPALSDTFRHERCFARSALFESPLKREMHSLGLEVDRLSLERARSKIFCAKADVLLNTGPRYHLLQADFLRERYRSNGRCCLG